MFCIISTLSTLLFLGWGALLGAKWLLKTVKNNRERITNFIYDTYNLPETTLQKVKVNYSSVKNNKR